MSEQQQVGRRTRAGNPKKDPAARRPRPKVHPARVLSTVHPDVTPPYLTRAQREEAKAARVESVKARGFLGAFAESMLGMVGRGR